MNPASLGTREMGLGTRYDTLDDQWGYWNWHILVQLGACIPEYTPHYLLFIEKIPGPSLSRRLEDALYESQRMRKQHETFTSNIDPQTISAWMEMTDAWNEDPFGAPSPYAELDHGQ